MNPSHPHIAVIQPRLAGFGGLEKFGAHIIAALAREYPVTVVSEQPVDPAVVERAFNVSLDGVTLRCDPRCNPPDPRPGRLSSLLDRRRAASGYEQITQEYDLIVGQTVTLPLRSAARRSLLLCHFPVVRGLTVDPSVPHTGPTARLTSRGRSQREIRRRLDSWTGIIANSEFTRGWVRRYWARESAVIHPPIDLPEAPDLSGKQPWVLHVGFFSPPSPGEQNSYKRQELLIDAFRRLTGRLPSGWELHLAGNALETPEVRRWLEELGERAAGIPVRFHVNCTHQELQTLYSAASIYWHATGFGVDPERHPEQMEHFGMATAEASGHGCVPVVIDRGGQPEIVEHGRTGYLWDDLSGLDACTLALARDHDRRAAMASAAIERSHRFGLPRFRDQLLALVASELAAAGFRPRA